MAIKQVRIDDLDGQEGANTVHFNLAGTNYEIDLTPANADKLHKVLQPYINAGRRKGRKPKTLNKTVVRTPQSPTDHSAIRAWARDHGHRVPNRGRIPNDVLTKFNAHHNGMATTS